jgi:hypothetical protein
LRILLYLNLLFCLVESGQTTALQPKGNKQQQQQQQPYQQQHAPYATGANNDDDGFTSARMESSGNYGGVTPQNNYNNNNNNNNGSNYPAYAGEDEHFGRAGGGTDHGGDLGYADAKPGGYSGPPSYTLDDSVSSHAPYATSSTPGYASAGNIDGNSPMSYSGAANIHGMDQYNQTPIANNKFGM